MTKRCPVRPAKVLELKAFFAQYEDRSPRDKLYYLYREKQYNKIQFGVSIYELAFALYPDDKIQRRGVVEPSRQAIDATRRYLNIVRNWIHNNSLLPYAGTYNGQSLIFNQNRETVHVVENKMVQTEQRIRRARGKINRIANMPEKERIIVAKHDDKSVEQQHLARLKRRKKLMITA
jgi:hypothetical protein